MSDTLTDKQYRELKKSVETCKTDAAEAKGRLDAAVATLKEEFNVKNLKEAQDALTALQLQAAIAEDNFQKAMKAYKKKWGADEDED